MKTLIDKSQGYPVEDMKTLIDKSQGCPVEDIGPLPPATGNSAWPSIYSRMQGEIERRDLKDHLHVVLPSDFRITLTDVWHWQRTGDDSLMKEVDEDLLQRISKFQIYTPPNSSAATMMAAVRTETGKKPSIWAQESRWGMATYPLPMEVMIENKELGCGWHLWIVATWSFKNDGDTTELVLSYLPEQREVLDRYLTDLKLLKNQIGRERHMLVMWGDNEVEIGSDSSWEDLILTPEVEALTRQDIEGWIAAEDRYRKMRVPYRRGYLFEGPPGNGKTAVARVMIVRYSFRAFGFDFSNSHYGDSELQELFRRAADTAPSLVLLEDIDRIFSGQHYTAVTLEGLFNCLDGIVVHDGVVVIATANHPERLDEAIRRRPGRFDVPVRFGNPDAEQRTRYLNFVLDRCEANGASPDGIAYAVCSSEGMSMAFCKLLFETAAIRATDGIVTDKLLQEASDLVKMYYDRMEIGSERKAGFAPDKSLPRDGERGRPLRSVRTAASCGKELKKADSTGVPFP